jgi:hypothetical protein
MCADRIDQLGEVEAGTASHIQDPFAGLGRDRFTDQASAPKRVARPVEDLQPLRRLLIKRKLSHVATPSKHQPRNTNAQILP